MAFYYILQSPSNEEAFKSLTNPVLFKFIDIFNEILHIHLNFNNPNSNFRNQKDPS